MHDPAAAAALSFQAAMREPPLLQEEQQHLRCPRCDSTNTKFCYYNNYNLSQPRHFCRDCRRYWTRGGALRNVPVGGGTRRSSKRASFSSSFLISPSKRSSAPSSAAAPVAAATPTATSPAPPLRSPSVGSAASGGSMVAPPPAPPPRTTVPEDVLRSQGDSNCWNGGGGWPDLSIYSPGSKFQ